MILMSSIFLSLSASASDFILGNQIFGSFGFGLYSPRAIAMALARTFPCGMMPIVITFIYYLRLTAFDPHRRTPPSSRRLGYRSRAQRINRDLRMQPDVERIKDLGRPFEGDSKVFIPLIARHLGFMHAESAGELSQGDALGDPCCDEQMSHGAQVIQFREFPSLQPLICLNFLLQLQMKGFNRVDDALDLF